MPSLRFFFNFLTPFRQTSQCSHSSLAHRASSKIQFLRLLGYRVSLQSNPMPNFPSFTPWWTEYTASQLFAAHSNWLFKKYNKLKWLYNVQFGTTGTLKWQGRGTAVRGHPGWLQVQLCQGETSLLQDSVHLKWRYTWALHLHEWRSMAKWLEKSFPKTPFAGHAHHRRGPWQTAEVLLLPLFPRQLVGIFSFNKKNDTIQCSFWWKDFAWYLPSSKG